MRFALTLLLALACTLPAHAADDRQALLAIEPGPALLPPNDVAQFIATAAVFTRPKKQILVDGELRISQPVTVREPAIARLWILLPDRVAELTPNPILYDGMRSLQFNAALPGTYPRGTRYEVAAEFRMAGGRILRLRTAEQCLDSMLADPLEPGETECPLGRR